MYKSCSPRLTAVGVAGELQLSVVPTCRATTGAWYLSCTPQLELQVAADLSRQCLLDCDWTVVLFMYDLSTAFCLFAYIFSPRHERHRRGATVCSLHIVLVRRSPPRIPYESPPTHAKACTLHLKRRRRMTVSAGWLHCCRCRRAIRRRAPARMSRCPSK